MAPHRRSSRRSITRSWRRPSRPPPAGSPPPRTALHHVHVRRQRPRDRVHARRRPGRRARRRSWRAWRPPLWRCSLETYTCRPPRLPDEAAGADAAAADSPGPSGRPFDINGAEPKKSPDEKLEALVNNYNVAIREAGKREVTLLSTDGSEGGYYDPDSLVWSPDSKKIAVYKVTPGLPPLRPLRRVLARGSAPAEGLDDAVREAGGRARRRAAGDLRRRHEEADRRRHALFPNAYDVSRLEWRKDSAAVTFEYNQRGHQLYRVIEIDAATGQGARGDQRGAEDFFCYSGKKIPAATSTTARKSSGCPSATAGTISISTTASPGR